jgi:hypothetical protein
LQQLALAACQQAPAAMRPAMLLGALLHCCCCKAAQWWRLQVEHSWVTSLAASIGAPNGMLLQLRHEAAQQVGAVTTHH